jgi:hypothetical protein
MRNIGAGAQQQLNLCHWKCTIFLGAPFLPRSRFVHTESLRTAQPRSSSIADATMFSLNEVERILIPPFPGSIPGAPANIYPIKSDA